MTDAAEIESEILVRYAERSPQSKAWFDRASQSLVAGVSGTVRYFRPYPLYFTGGSGSKTTDLDGNEYVDCVLSNGSLLLGHRHPEIMASLARCADLGSLIINPVLATEVAEHLQKMVPCAERVRFVNTGTEAVLTAMRFARAHTGRSKIIKFAGAYHGQTDQVLVGLDPRGRPASAGISTDATAETLIASLEDMAEVQALLNQGDIAAVLLDPTMHHTGLWAGNRGIYQQIREMTRKAGSLLIFDEVISGFRLDAGGAQTFFDITPDIAVFAKALGVGEKLAAVVGSKAVMNVADPSPERMQGAFAFQSGTNNDATSGLATAKAALTCYQRLRDEGQYDVIIKRAEKLAAGFRTLFNNAGVAVHVNQLGPMLRLFFVDGARTYSDCSKENRRAVTLFHLALITEGV